MSTKTNGQYSARFVSGYRGAAEYLVTGPGLAPDQRVEVRTFAHDDGGYNAGVFDREILAFVGCVRLVHGDGVFQFPPADVVALFPGFVGARYAEGWQAEYLGAPEVVTRFGSYTWARVDSERIDAMERGA